ncbi:hypothetical protein DC522_28560 [Microvirga sp. KLBC 81]|nr:hypothetical protein DC522_28560 [Microvirga sp. KLBC 81]
MLAVTLVHGNTGEPTKPLHDRAPATRTETGLPVRVMRFRTSTARATSACCFTTLLVFIGNYIFRISVAPEWSNF